VSSTQPPIPGVRGFFSRGRGGGKGVSLVTSVAKVKNEWILTAAAALCAFMARTRTTNFFIDRI